MQMEHYVLVKYNDMRCQAGYIPVEEFSWEVFRDHQLKVVGAWRNVYMWGFDKRALDLFGLSYDEFLVYENAYLRQQIEELESGSYNKSK